MSKQPVKEANALGVDISGTPEAGQRMTLSRQNAVEEIFGTENPQMATALTQHCLKVLKHDEASDDHAGNDERSFMLVAVAEIAPRDAMERMLAVQMAATHVAMVRAGRLLANTSRVDLMKVHYSGYNMLARTYATQMAALRKHRDGGKQVVRVQNVNVEGGGQAIVGSVQTGARADAK